jgi:CRP/FNR family transcriptional regulator, anaerobic regulatory protein
MQNHPKSRDLADRNGATTPREPVLNIVKLKTACSSCNMREVCLPIGLTLDQIDELDQLVYARKKVKRGTGLYAAGDAFEALYAVRTGFFKTSVVSEDGLGQVTGFQMAGEILGMDGIGTDRHDCSAVALEDSDICVIPFARLEDLARQMPSLQNHFHRVMSREIVRDHGVMMMLGSMRAEERLAAFLLNLSQRFALRGYSPSEFILRMTREEIGSYLGLKLETVSRIFSKFHEDGLVGVQQKHIRITDSDGLKSRVGQTC